MPWLSLQSGSDITGTVSWGEFGKSSEKWVKESLWCYKQSLICNSDVNSRMPVGMSAVWCIFMGFKTETRSLLGIRVEAICAIWHTFCPYLKTGGLNIMI